MAFPIAAIIKIAQAAAKVGGEIGAQTNWTTRTNKKLTKRAYSDLMNNRLGTTNAEKALEAGRARQQIAATLAPQQELLNRQTAAAGPVYAGAMSDQQAALANAAANAQAQVQQGVEARSQDQAQAQQAEIKNRITTQSEIAKADWRRMGGMLSGEGKQPATDTSSIYSSSAYAQRMSK